METNDLKKMTAEEQSEKLNVEKKAGEKIEMEKSSKNGDSKPETQSESSQSSDQNKTEEVNNLQSETKKDVVDSQNKKTSAADLILKKIAQAKSDNHSDHKNDKNDEKSSKSTQQEVTSENVVKEQKVADPVNNQPQEEKPVSSVPVDKSEDAPQPKEEKNTDKQPQKESPEETKSADEVIQNKPDITSSAEKIQEKTVSAGKEEQTQTSEKQEFASETEPETREQEVEEEKNSEQEQSTEEEKEEDTGKRYGGESELESIDFNSLSQQELLDKFRDLIDNYPFDTIRDAADVFKTHFYKKHHAEIAEKRKEFISKGGAESDFNPGSNPFDDEFKELLKRFKEAKSKFADEQEKEKQENLKLKYQVIEELKELTKGTESLNQTFQEFRDLQKRWHEIGLVPQSEVKMLWETYHHHVEKFYDYIKLNKELRDLDLKKNLEAKIELCAKAEELLLESSVVKAFRTLQKYHAQWREIGPVPRDKKDELWDRFKEATTKINKAHQEHFERIKEEQQNNLKAKTIICDKADELAELDLKTHKEWDDKSKEIIELQKIWKLIGFAPKKDNNRIYARFRSACDTFFDKKRKFYAANKEEQENNLRLKTELCIQAEGLNESTDWKRTTEIFINIQKKWKTIGPVPRKHSDAIWKRFRTACNTFFDRKKEYFSSIDKEQEKNLERKKDLISKVQEIDLSTDQESKLVKLKEYQKEWTEIGHVPIKMKDEVQKQFRDALNEKFDNIKMDEGRRKELKFKTKIETLKNSPKGFNKIKYEREKLANKLKELENNIVVWENNIGFFTKSKNAESLIDEVNNKISSAKKKANEYKEKLKIMDNIETEGNR